MKIKKKTVIITVVAALVLIPAGAAFAYWTVGGSGTGTATTGTVADITVSQTSTITDMAPGDTPQTLSGDFTNTNSGPVYVSTVTASISSVTPADGAPTGTCDDSDYTLSNATMTVDAEVPAGTDKGAWTGATVQFNDKPGTNQDACQGATVNFAYTIG